MSSSLFRHVLPCVLFLLSGLAVATAQEKNPVFYNTTPYDSLNPDPNSAGRYSALWGYTAPDGREYALLSGFRGTHIVDITEKPIRQVAFIQGPNSGWREMKTYRHYAYVVSEGGDGLQIIDLAGLPDTAVLVASDTSVFRSGHTISQEGDWIYVHGSNVQAGANQGTLIFNVSDDPEHPRFVGQYERGYVHDAQIRNDTMYAAMINDGRLDIVYLGADRTKPKLITDISYPGAGTHNADLTFDGRYVMTTDEVGETEKTLKVWDLGDIGDIAKVADWTADDNAIIHNVHIRGTVAYISWYTAGTRIVDISDPLNPAEIGFYDFFPGAGKRYAGNWEVYPYFASGKIISSDMSTGLYVFTFDGAKKGLTDGIVLDANTNEPIGGATVEFPNLGKTVHTDALGRFALLAAEGAVDYVAYSTNYRVATGTIELTSDGSETEIRLDPLVLRDLEIVPVDRETGERIRRFSFEIATRGEQAADPQHQALLHLPADSGYTVHIGAWGWLPTDMTIPPNTEGELIVQLEPGYSDDAEIDLGWSLGLPDDDGIGGAWERGEPIGVEISIGVGDPVTVEPAEDHTDGEGRKAFLTQIIDSPETAPGAADIDSGRVTLTSPLFDLTRYDDPGIEFALFYSNDAFPFVEADDKLYVRLSNDSGRTWTDIVVLDKGADDWLEYDIRVRDVMQPTSTMFFRVVASDSGTQGWSEAGLDDFRVTGERISGVSNGAVAAVGVSMELAPNPMREQGTLILSADRHHSRSRIDIFDSRGALRETLYDGPIRVGVNMIELGAVELPAGSYHVRCLLPDGTTTTATMTVVH